MRWLLLFSLSFGIACSSPTEKMRNKFWSWLETEGAELQTEINTDIAVERLQLEVDHTNAGIHLTPGQHPNEHTLTVTADDPEKVKSFLGDRTEASGWKFVAGSR